MQRDIGIWFPTIQTGTGTDVFTERLVRGLNQEGIQAEITWLPLRAEYAPWTVPIPPLPKWATIAHINTWLHPRFIPTQLPVVATIHHAIHHPDAQNYKGWLQAAYHKYWISQIERQTMRRVCKIIAVSKFVADAAKQTLIDMEMQVIYNGIDTNVFYPENQANHHASQPFRLLYVGTWIKRKGIDLFAPIMSELGNEFELYYTGGPKAKKDKRNMPSNMHDLGRLSRDEVIAEMRRADAFLFPSRSEGLPLVAIEAMACGLPVIAAHGTSLMEVVEDGKTGFLCKKNDYSDFCSAIHKMKKDKERMEYMRQKSSEIARNKFCLNSTINSYLFLYKEIINKI